MELNSLPKVKGCGKSKAGRKWVEIRHPVTGKRIADYCAESRELEVVDRGKRAVIELPSQ